jgi:hypothetical protein
MMLIVSQDKTLFIKEAMVMLQLSHPNAVRMIGVSIQQKPWLCVLEFMFYGDLRGVLLVCILDSFCLVFHAYSMKSSLQLI